MKLHYNGVGIAGTGLRFVRRLAFQVLNPWTFFAAVGVIGGQYVCNFSALKVDVLLKNNSESCGEIKRLCDFQSGIAFTDLRARNVKYFCPSIDQI